MRTPLILKWPLYMSFRWFGWPHMNPISLTISLTNHCNHRCQTCDVYDNIQNDLTVDEYRNGLARVERLVRWLQPGAVCFVGLAGWRVAVDRAAVAGRQEIEIGGRPVYVMPSTSGLNANSRLDDLIEHLRAAAKLAAQG